MLAASFTAPFLVIVLAFGACRSAAAQQEAPADLAAQAAYRFLDRYVAPDGRVVRHDEGGDTVSEGQAYALLMAVAVGDAARFARIWEWTRVNLQRPDSLLAYRWQDGRIADDPATDADLDAMRALLLAGRRFDTEAYRSEGLRIAAAVLEHETVVVGNRPVLVAGPWARASPHVVNPSYFSSRAYRIAWQATGDPRWSTVSASSRVILGGLMTRTTRLPPEWASVSASGEVRPRGSASGSPRPIVYGYNAMRVPLRLAESCDPRSRRLAAAMWPFLGRQARTGDGIAARYRLDGRPAAGRFPGAEVAAAAAAAAAGRPAWRDRLLARAERLERSRPSYYGAALVALGRLMLTTNTLGRCGA